MDSCHSVRRKRALVCAISRGGEVLLAGCRALPNVAPKAETIEEKRTHLTAFLWPQMTKHTVTHTVFQVTNLQQVTVLGKKLFKWIENTTLRGKTGKGHEQAIHKQTKCKLLITIKRAAVSCIRLFSALVYVDQEVAVWENWVIGCMRFLSQLAPTMNLGDTSA